MQPRIRSSMHRLAVPCRQPWCSDRHAWSLSAHFDAYRQTVILYLNEAWRAGDGGELLIYPKVDLAAAGADGASAVGRIPPKGNRLLIFFADTRVPHEVLPSYAERYAVTVWYYDIDEVRRASGATSRN